MRQAAHYDLHTTEGLAQVQHLRFILPSGEVDTQYNGMTIRGGVLVDVIQDMPGSEVVDGRCALQLPRLAAGCHRYDVLVSDDGTDKPLLAGVIHVAPRVTPVDLDDNAPADYLDIVIPEDEGGTITVISESPAWVDDAVEKSLQERGMYVSPTSGTVSMSPPGYDQDQTVAWSWARFRFGDDMLGGYRGSVCKVRDVYMWSVIGTTDTTPRWLDIWRRAPGGDWVLAARSGQAVASSTDVDLYMWGMIAETEIVIGDEVALHVYSGTPEAPVELPLSIARQMVTATDGRGLTDALDGPITDATVMPAVMLSCTYQDGVSVGGVNLATRAEVARVKDYADNVNKEVYASARQVAGDADQVATDKQAVEDARAKLEQDIAAAQAILAAMPQVDDAGNMTLGGTITATACMINGQLVVNNPAGSIGNGTHNQIHGTTWFYDGVEFRAGAIIRGNTFLESGTLNISKAASINCNGPATYGATINANGGINIPQASQSSLTATTAVNASTAVGMMGLSDVWQCDTPVNRSGNAVYGDGTFMDWPTGGQGIAFCVPRHGHGSADVDFNTYLTGGDWSVYGDWLGFYLPLGILLLSSTTSGVRGKVKFTWTLHAENANNFDYKNDATDFDLFTLTPRPGQQSPVIDVTIEPTQSGNAPVRVRVLNYDTAADSYKLTTVNAQVPGLSGHGEGCRGLVWCQQGNVGGLWLIVSTRIYKIATIPFIWAYESRGLYRMHVDMFGGDVDWVDTSKVCFSRVRNFSKTIFGGLPCYDVAEAMGVNCQISTETAPWTPPN